MAELADAADSKSAGLRSLGIRYPPPGTSYDTAAVVLQESASKPAARASGQVAQMVERSPEKAGVGGSIPSLATIH